MHHRKGVTDAEEDIPGKVFLGTLCMVQASNPDRRDDREDERALIHPRIVQLAAKSASRGLDISAESLRKPHLYERSSQCLEHQAILKRFISSDSSAPEQGVFLRRTLWVTRRCGGGENIKRNLMDELELQPELFGQSELLGLGAMKVLAENNGHANLMEWREKSFDEFSSIAIAVKSACRQALVIGYLQAIIDIGNGQPQTEFRMVNPELE